MHRQNGFTLIELVIVIVILGVLSVTALPKFVDLSTEAGNAATQGIVGALGSSSSANFAAKAAGRTGMVDVKVDNVCVAAVVGNLLAGVSFVNGTSSNTSGSTVYGISGTGNCTSPSVAAAAGTAVTCSLIGSKGVVQSATIICSG
ncbi:MAG: type II secretion system protein [Pseudomonadota bacterium]